MNAKRKSCRRSPLHIVTGPAAVALLLSAVAAEAGWKPPAPGPTAAAVAAAAGIGYSLRKNQGELVEQAGRAVSASMEGDTKEVERLVAETDRFSGKLVVDSHPVLRGLSWFANTPRDAATRLREKLRSAQRKIGRLVSRAGETVLDARAALAVDRTERRWYESESGILDTRPLPAVRVPVPSGTPVSGAAAAPVQDDDFLSWRERGTNPVGDYALRCGGKYGVSRYSVYYSEWQRLMERYSGDCPPDDPSQREWSAVLNEGDAPDPWAPEQEEQPAENPLPVEPDPGSYNQEDDTGYEDSVADYRTELAALEGRRRAEEERQRLERERAAEEARIREQEEARSRAERERLEYQRKAAERERRELERELAAARNSQFLRDSINQGVQRMNQTLQELQELRAGKGGGVRYYDGECKRPIGYTGDMGCE